MAKGDIRGARFIDIAASRHTARGVRPTSRRFSPRNLFEEALVGSSRGHGSLAAPEMLKAMPSQIGALPIFGCSRRTEEKEESEI